jgi:hypothetical protein
VNQIVLNDLTHQQAAETLKNAVKTGTQLTLSVLQDLDFNKLFFLRIPTIESLGGSIQNSESESGGGGGPSGFRINHNFNTYQQREVEIIFIADHKRYNQLCKGDILLQINGKNVDAISEKDLNKFVINSNNPKAPSEFFIQSLTVYRPFVEDQISNDSNQDDDDSSSQQDNEQHDDNNTTNTFNNINNSNNSNLNNIHSNENGQLSNGNGNSHSMTTTTTTTHHQNGIKNNIEENSKNLTPKPTLNRHVNSSTPIRNKEITENGDGNNKEGIGFF